MTPSVLPRSQIEPNLADFQIKAIPELRELFAKFWNSMIKIHEEIICQSWPLLTSFYSSPIVQ